MMDSTMSGDIKTQHMRTNSSYLLSSTALEGWWLGLILQARDHELICMPKYSRKRRAAISLAQSGSCSLSMIEMLWHLGELCITKCPHTSMNWKQDNKEEWMKIPPKKLRLIKSYRKWSLQLLLLWFYKLLTKRIWLVFSASAFSLSFCWIKKTLQ